MVLQYPWYENIMQFNTKYTCIILHFTYRAGSCISLLWPKVNCRQKVLNCEIITGLTWPAQFFFYNSLISLQSSKVNGKTLWGKNFSANQLQQSIKLTFSHKIDWYMIRPSTFYNWVHKVNFKWLWNTSLPVYNSPKCSPKCTMSYFHDLRQTVHLSGENETKIVEITHSEMFSEMFSEI